MYIIKTGAERLTKNYHFIEKNFNSHSTPPT